MALLAPSPISTPDVWAAANRQYGPTAAIPGARDPMLTPYIVDIERLVASGTCKRVVLACASQMGKSEMLLDIAGQRLDQRPAPILYVGPNKQFLTEQFEPRIMALLDEAPTLMAKVARGKRMTKTRKVVAGVPFRLAHSGSSSALKSDPAALALVDEYDEMLANIKGQGDPLGLVERRGDTFADFVCVVTSTPRQGMVQTERDELSGLIFWAIAPNEDIASPIWRLWQQGTRHHCCWPCPHCADYFVPRFDRVRWPEDATPAQAAKASWVECPRCGGVITEEHKADLNARRRFVAPGQQVDSAGNVTGEPAQTTTASYWVSGLLSPFVPIGDRVKSHLEAVALGDGSMIQTSMNGGFGEVYTPGGIDINDWQQVAARRGVYHFGEVPAEVIRLTCAIDVQKRGVYYCIRGWGGRATSFVIDAGEIAGFTDDAEVWGDVAQLITTAHAGLSISLCLIDSGFRPGKINEGSANAVYQFCRRFPRLARPTKGYASLSAPIIRTRTKVAIPGRQMTTTIELVRLDTDFWKSRLHERLAWPEGQAGGITLAADCSVDYCKMLVSERRVVNALGKPEWIVINRRNHYLDCFDPETELLTKGGWVPVAQAARPDLEFATVDLATDEIEYQVATAFVKRRHVGQMIAIKGRRVDAVVTPNHRMVTYRSNPIDSVPRMTLAKDLTIWHRIKLTAKWTGADAATMILPETRIRTRRGAGTVELIEAQRIVDAGDWCELLGWYVADGHRRKIGQSRQVVISHNPRLRELFGRLGFGHRVIGHQLTVTSRQLFAGLDDCEEPGDDRSSFRKRVPQMIKDASPRLIARFVDAAMLGDGWQQGRSRAYATTSAELADGLQELMLKLGRTGNVRCRHPPPCTLHGATGSPAAQQFHVSECGTSAALLRRADNTSLISTVSYDGMIYCVTVPNGTLIARRNGLPFIVGNCEAMNEAAGHLLGVARIPVGTMRDMPDEGDEPDPGAPNPAPPEGPPPPVAVLSPAAASRDRIRRIAERLNQKGTRI
jgi:phage terminase large subunit GpA-like protein